MTTVENRRTVVEGPGKIPVSLEVNGRRHVVDLEPRVSLLDALRERLDLTGSKKPPVASRWHRPTTGWCRGRSSPTNCTT